MQFNEESDFYNTEKGGHMEVLETTEKEMLQKNIEEFSRLQSYMEVYRDMRMRQRYIELKVILTASGINLTELDRIKA